MFSCFLHSPMKGNVLSRHAGVSKSTSILYSTDTAVLIHGSFPTCYRSHLYEKSALMMTNSMQNFTGHTVITEIGH